MIIYRYKNIGNEKDSSTYLLVPSTLAKRLNVSNSVSDHAVDHPYTVVDINDDVTDGQELVSFTSKKEPKSDVSYLYFFLFYFCTFILKMDF